MSSPSITVDVPSEETGHNNQGKEESWFKRNYMFSASCVAIITALTNLAIICWMNYDKLDLGLGLAAIGIATFIGTTIASSIFEEHRHDHKNETKNQPLHDALVGKGIMRKALAASLVMTYIVLIGLSFSDGSLNNLLANEIGMTDSDTTDSALFDNSTSVGTSVYNFNITTFSNSTIMINSRNVVPDIDISEIVKFPSITNKLKSTEDVVLMKDSNSLVQHFTILISIVIGFYFGSNALNAYLKSKNQQLNKDELSKINLTKLTKGEIAQLDYDKIQEKIDKTIP